MAIWCPEGKTPHISRTMTESEKQRWLSEILSGFLLLCLPPISGQKMYNLTNPWYILMPLGLNHLFSLLNRTLLWDVRIYWTTASFTQSENTKPIKHGRLVVFYTFILRSLTWKRSGSLELITIWIERVLISNVTSVCCLRSHRGQMKRGLSNRILPVFDIIESVASFI